MNNLKKEELKELIINSIKADADAGKASEMLKEYGVNYDFRQDLGERIMARISSGAVAVVSEMEFLRSLNLAFYRIALSGVAAIVLLLISIYLTEGTLSLNSFLGLSDSYNESTVCLLTGN